MSVQLVVSVTVEMHEALAKLAIEREVPIVRIINEAIATYLAQTKIDLDLDTDE